MTLSEFRNSHDWFNRLEYARATGDWEFLKDDENEGNRIEAEHYLDLKRRSKIQNEENASVLIDIIKKIQYGLKR